MKTFTYLAIAYTDCEQESFEHSMEAVAVYAALGIIVYSPIVHCHPVAKAHTLPTNYLHWQKQAQGMIRGATSLDVLVPDGWEDQTMASTGVSAEAKYAHGRGLPVRIVTIRDKLFKDEIERGDEIRYALLGGM